MNKYLISIVVPFFNEQEVVDSFYKRLTESINKCEKNDSEIKFELIFVDNGSTDNTFDILSNLNDESRNIKIIKLIRNFGIDGGLKAGLSHSQSDATILIHGDLQDNPDEIFSLIKYWKQGYKQVVIKYKPMKRENLFRKIGSYFYYKWATFASNGLIMSGVSDFRLISKEVLNTYLQLPESINLLRGILVWPGYTYMIHESEKSERIYGKSKLDIPTIIKYFKLPISLSPRLLYVIPAISILLFLFGSLFITVTFFYWIFSGNLIIEIEPRLTILIIITLLTSIMLGVVAAYLGIIFEEIKRRPNFIVEQVINKS